MLQWRPEEEDHPSDEKEVEEQEGSDDTVEACVLDMDTCSHHAVGQSLPAVAHLEAVVRSSHHAAAGQSLPAGPHQAVDEQVVRSSLL